MSATVPIAFLALLVGGTAAQQRSAGNLPVFDTTLSALPPSFTPVTARRIYRRLQVPPKSEFETEEAYRGRLKQAFVSGTHAIPLEGFRLTYDADSGAFSVLYETEQGMWMYVVANGVSDAGMIVSGRSSKLLRTESRTNAFGARVEVQVWVDTLFGVVPLDDSGVPRWVIVPKWRISADSAQAIKPFVAAILQVTLAAMPDGRQTDLGMDGDSPTITIPRDVNRFLHIVFVRDAKLVLYDRRSGRVLTRLPMLTRSPEEEDSLSPVEGGIGTGIVPSSDQVFMVSVVEERPELLTSPPLQYPDLLREAGVQGRVLVQAIIDTLGRAEPASVKVIQSPNPGFDQPAKNLVLKSQFRPARIKGRPVRVLINLPIDFNIEKESDDVVPASVRWAVFPPPGAPREVRGRKYEVKFWVSAEGRVTRVEVSPPIKDEGYRREFTERMMGVLFNPATTRDGRPVDYIATVTLIP